MTRRVKIQRSRNIFNENSKRIKANLWLLRWLLKPFETRRRMELHQERILTSQIKRELAETEKAIKGNRMVLLEIEIERKKLELEKLRRELGDANDFRPPLDEREE